MTEAIDAKWYDAYQALPPGRAVYAVLRDVPDADEQKARFIAENFSKNPQLTPNIDLEAVNTREYCALALRAKLTETNVEPVITDAYVPLLNAKLNAVKLQRAAASNDVEGFVMATTESYGDLDPQMFTAATAHFHDWSEKHLHDPANALVAQAAREALDVLPEAVPAHIWPSDSEFATVQHLYADFFDDMYAGVELPEEASGEAVTKIVKQVLANLQYDYSVIAQDTGVNTMEVNQKRRHVKVPQHETYQKKRLKGLLAHEIRIHVEDSELGAEQPLKILSKGLRGYLPAAEGRGLMVEQLAYDTWSEFMATRRFADVARRHLSIGLARGVDGAGERDFKQVFHIMHAIDKLWELVQTPTEPEQASTRAIDRTWELLTKRTLKGVVGTGAAYFKDKVYAEGNHAQLQLHLQHPEVKPYINKGSYDLTNADHRSILKRIGAIPVWLLA